jgi:hypothetical protein
MFECQHFQVFRPFPGVYTKQRVFAGISPASTKQKTCEIPCRIFSRNKRGFRILLSIIAKQKETRSFRRARKQAKFRFELSDHMKSMNTELETFAQLRPKVSIQ